MAARSSAIACTTAAQLMDTFAGETVVLVLTTASATVYVGGPGVTAANGLKLMAGAAVPFTPVNIGVITGPLYVIGAAGSEAVSWIATK